MNANTVIFLISIVLGFLVAGVFAVWKYSHGDGAAVVDMLLGQCCTLCGMLVGTLIVVGMFAFIAGKLTN